MDADTQDRFIDAYAEALDAGHVGYFSVVEQRRHIGPVTIDVDLRQVGAERAYSSATLSSFVDRLFEALADLVDVPIGARCFLLEKPAPRPLSVRSGAADVDPHRDPDRATHKDGVHLVLPDVVTRPETQDALRRSMLPCTASTFGTLASVTNDAVDIYDEAVVYRNGWMMYGSKKPDEPHPWLATAVFVLVRRDPDVLAERRPLPDDLRASPGRLARLLSVRFSHDETPLSANGREAVQQLLDAAEAARKLREERRNIRISRAAEDIGDSSTSLDDLSAALGLLDDARAAAYATWRDVGLVLHHETAGAAGGLALWCDFGRRCPGKFDADEHADEWERIGRGALDRDDLLRIGSLMRWAAIDSPVRYKAWRAERRLTTTTTTAQITSDEAMEGARRLLAAMACDGNVVDIEAPIPDAATGTVSFAGTHMPSGLPCVVRFRASDLLATVTLGDGTTVYDRHLNRDDGLRVGRDLCRVHKDIPPDQTWTVTRPSAKKAVFRGAERGTEVNLLNVDRPGTEMVARVSVPDSKPHQVTQKAHIAFMMDAYNESVRMALARMDIGWMVSIVGDNNRVVLNGPPEDPRTADSDFIGALNDAGIASDVVSVDEAFYVHNAASGLWEKSTANEAACFVRAAARSGGRLDGLSAPDRAYLKSFDGPIKVLKSLAVELRSPGFLDRLDKLPDGHIPLDDGMLDGRTGVLRPFVKEDYVTKTLGYAFGHSGLDRDTTALVERFYDQVLPVAVEREYFLRIVGCALFSKERAKMFLVITDERDGSTGKTTMMRAIESVFGDMHAIAERDFLYESGFANANGASANFLSYAGKRLAFFDEPDDAESRKRLDIRRIKDLTSGDSRIRGRLMHDNEMREYKWEPLIVIACNEANFPKFDASDRPLVKRLKVVRMRSVFRASSDCAQGDGAQEEHVYPMGCAAFKDRLNVDARLAHLDLLMRAYQRSEAEADMPEPGCVSEMVNKLLEASDPRVEKVLEFIEATIDFAPERTEAGRGKKYYAWIPAKDVLTRFWAWYTGPTDGNPAYRLALGKDLAGKSGWKRIVGAAMASKGRPAGDIKPVTDDGDRSSIRAYNGVAWR